VITRRHGLASTGEPSYGSPPAVVELIASLAAAGIGPRDPGLVAWRKWNAAVAGRAGSLVPGHSSPLTR
jgi:hypothetical protein